MDDEISLIELGAVSLKGFEQAVEVIQAIAKPFPARTEPRLASGENGELPQELDPLTPLVDREHEIRWLRGTWRQVRRGHGRVLFVSGQHMIGKTRLAAEIACSAYRDGGVIRYSGPGGAAAATAIAAIHETMQASTPTLLVLDDVDIAGPPVLEALSSSLDVLSKLPVLVLALVGDPTAALDVTAVLERVDERGDGHRALEPFDLEGVRGIIRLYVGDDTADVPVESMARASAGVPGRVHEVVSDWAHSEASRRLAAAGEFLAAGRVRHASDLKFADNVIGLKLGRLYSLTGRDVLPGDIGHCPYKGLATFEERDAAYFFGRERLVGELAARTVQIGLLGVVGASGSGKSSVIAAGLLPSLRAGLLPGSEQWDQIAMRPGEHPMTELRAALFALAPDATDLSLLAVLDAAPDDRRLVLVVDQFEEAFTMCASEDERATFIATLTEVATQRPERVEVILSIRGDYYAHAATYPELAAALAANHVLVGPLTREELSRAIELPARRAGVRLESALVDALVEEVADEPGALPLLSAALVELWQTRDGGWIRMPAFEYSGGVRGAVARLGEASYEQLSDIERVAARRIFLRLALIGEGEAATRRRVALDELDLDRDAAAVAAVSRFTQDRLLTIGENTVEVAHEALLREWPRLQGWLEEDEQGRQLRHHLTLASRQWRSGGEEPSELYRGARLSATLDWAAEHGTDLNELERDFLSTARQAGARESERQRRTNRRLRGLLTGAAVFLVLALVAGSVALVQRSHARAAAASAQRSATVSLANSLGAEAVDQPRLDVALLLAREALNVDPSVETRSDLLWTLMRSPQLTGGFSVNEPGVSPDHLVLSPDGKTVAVGLSTGRPVFYDTRSLRGVASPKGLGWVGAYSSRAPMLVALTPDSTGDMVVANSRTYQHVRTIDFPAEYEPDYIQTAGPIIGFADRIVLGSAVLVSGQWQSILWDISERPYHKLADLRLFGKGVAVTGVSFSPSGRTILVSGTSGEVWMITASGTKLREFTGLSGLVESALFSPDGRFVLADDWQCLPAGCLSTRGIEGRLAMWDADTGRLVHPLLRIRDAANQLSFSPNGSLIAVPSGAAAASGHTYVVNVRSWRIVRTLDSDPGTNATTSAVFAPSGHLLASVGNGGLLRLWDTRSWKEIGQPVQVSSGTAYSLSFNPTGQLLATGAADGTVRILNVSNPSHVSQFGPPSLPATSLVTFTPGNSSRFSAGGSRLVVLDSTGLASVYPMEWQQWAAYACTVAGRNLTQSEWEVFVGTSRRYAKVCPGLPLPG